MNTTQPTPEQAAEAATLQTHQAQVAVPEPDRNYNQKAGAEARRNLRGGVPEHIPDAETPADPAPIKRRKVMPALPPVSPLSVEQLTAHTAKLVRTERERQGIPMVQFAEYIGINKETLRRIEKGENMPRLDVARRMAIALGLPPEEMLGIEPAHSAAETWPENPPG